MTASRNSPSKSFIKSTPGFTWRPDARHAIRIKWRHAPPLPNELIDEFAAGNGSIFIGAGLSMGAGLPSWGKLIDPLKAEIAHLPPDTNYLDTAQFYVNEHGPRRLTDYLIRTLAGYQAAPTDTHRLLVAIPGLPPRIFTTNFDSLIEAACSEAKRPYRRIVNTEDVPSLDSSLITVFKLHGDLDLPASIVLTADQFENYFSDHPAIADLLKVELQTRTVLFLGYSFNDFDLRMILSRVGRESRQLRRNLFTVLFNPNPAIVEDLDRRGVKTVSLTVAAGGDYNAVLRDWVRQLSDALSSKARLSAPAALPRPNNNLPPRAGEFIGRKLEFARAVEGLKSRFPLITIEGFAGIGKTLLAIEVGHACLPNSADAAAGAVFAYVVWISAKDKPDQKEWLDDVMNAIANTTGFSATAQKPPQSPEKRSDIDRLLRSYKILLIIDNYETTADPELTSWLEAIPEPSKVLVTSRSDVLHQKAWPVVLKGLDRPDWLTLIRQYATQIGLSFLHNETDEHLLRLWEVTAGNPQAMKLSLGLVRGGALFSNIIDQLHAGNPTESMDVVFEELFTRSWNGLGVSGQCVLLVTPLFVGVSSIRRDALRDASGLGAFDFGKGLAACISFELLEVDHLAERVTLHSMTRAFARKKLSEQPGVEAAARARIADHFLEFIRLKVRRNNLPAPYWNALVSDGMNDLDREWPSIQEVMRWADESGAKDQLIEFVMLLVHYMDSRFLNLERLEYLHKAVAALAEAGRFEEEALLRIDALGWTYVEEGRLNEAEREIALGLAITEGRQDPSRNNLRALAYAWRARGKIEADDIDAARESIAIAQKLPCDPWIKCRVNMAEGDIALKQGNSHDALTCYQRAAASQREYGGEGRDYQIGPRMGLAYIGANRFEEAEALFGELANLDQIAIGKLYGYYGLALIAYKKNETLSARAYVEDIHTKLSQRSKSNLLWKLNAKLFADLETSRASNASSLSD